MTDDLIERLRMMRNKAAEEAADEIERLLAEVNRTEHERHLTALERDELRAEVEALRLPALRMAHEAERAARLEVECVDLRAELAEAKADAESWAEQADQRTKDAVQFIEERDRLRELLREARKSLTELMDAVSVNSIVAAKNAMPMCNSSVVRIDAALSADDTGKGGIVSDDPREIYLQLECCADPVEGRLWCEDDEPQKCEEGVPWTRYVVGWEYDRLRAEVADQKDAFNKLNEVLAENLEDRKRLRAEIAKLREAVDNNDAAFIDRMTVERTRLRALLRVAGAALRQVHEGRRHPQLALSIIARIDAALSKEKS